MLKARGLTTLVIIAGLALSACGRRNKEPHLMNIRSNTAGPDEFTVLPGKPLEAPDFKAPLPTPTPGGTNLTDPTPKADAVAALGGNPARVATTGAGNIGRGDGALVSHASRFGVAGGIRQTLAAEDVDYRRRHNGKLLERWFNLNTYYKAYKPLSLDQYRELERFRRLGVRTPSVPPDPNRYQ
ncbi:MAG TPA: DUF3035 domain-containing protein [Rhodobacteraceae bacterium]|nr:DUF3035 domain-containing protein [Paracoccaceae bacterium]